MRIFLIFLMAILLGVMGVSGVAHAAEKMIEGQVPDDRPLTPDYSKLYYLGYNKETSSSPCIGNPVTAECALVSYEACIAWYDKALCKLMNSRIPVGAENYGPDKRATQIYKFLSKRQLTAEDIPENYRDLWQVGDTVVFAASQVCTRYDHCVQNRPDPKGKCLPLDCDDAGEIVEGTGKHPTDIYVLRKKLSSDGAWEVITMFRSYYMKDPADRPEKLYQEGLAQSPW